MLNSDAGLTRRHALGGLLLAAASLPHLVHARPRNAWVTSWAASSQGPYPAGATVAMPDQSTAFPDPVAGAGDQSFRMIVRPSVWASRARLRFSNAFGTRSVTFDGAHVGLQASAGAVMPGTNRPVTFAGRRSITVPPGAEVWSDPVALPFAASGAPMLAGRKLAVSFHVAGASGPMTWHAKGLQTSYLGLPGGGSHGGEEGEHAFPLTTTAWFFVSAVDMLMPAGTPLVVCLGDSITDGTNSTLNGDDRWPDVLQRRLAARFPNRVAVVDAGIGGNQVTGPDSYDARAPFRGGPAAIRRIDRDVAALSGVRTVIWLEGINDLSRKDGASAAAVIEGYRTGVARLRRMIPGVRIVGATITPSLGAEGNAGTAQTDERRRAINAAIRAGGLFDFHVDFERAVNDPATGKLGAAFVPDSTTGGPGDLLHPNRLGYQAMAGAIDLDMILPGLTTGVRRQATAVRKL